MGRLKGKFETTYEFTKQFVIGGMNLLERNMDWIGENAKECLVTLTSSKV